jgi:serine/threonine-protein phosphatase 2B regulatory subunit
MSIPELQQNPLVQRVIDIFDTDGNGEIDFKGDYFLSEKNLLKSIKKKFSFFFRIHRWNFTIQC